MAGPKVVIIGGSVGGLFAGVLLARAGFDVRVFERSETGLDGRGAGLVGQREIFAILRAAGCEQVAQLGVVARERITLDRAGSIFEQQATPQSQLSWDRLYRAFRERLPDDRYRLGKAATRVEEVDGGVRVSFHDGSVEEADIVVGADGIGSRIRAAVTGDEPSYAGYVAWRGLYPEGDLPPGAADVLSERFAFYHYTRSHILGYLVPGADGAIEPGQRRYNWVWYRQAAAGRELAAALTDKGGRRHPFSIAPGAMSDAGVEALKRAARDDLPPPFAQAVEATAQPFVQAIFDHRSTRMAQGRLALLGDAAFVVRPHTAMGVAKAAGDALALVAKLKGETDPCAALRAYDAERRPAAEAIAAYGRRLGASLG